MTPEELLAAEAELRARPEYAWLFASGLQWFTTSDIAKGTGLAATTVRRRAEQGDIPGAAWYGDTIGWRVPRSGVIEWLARTLRGDTRQSAG